MHVSTNSEYGVPDIIRKFMGGAGEVFHGAGKAYDRMNKYEKAAFWLTVLALPGIITADYTLNDGKLSKSAVKYADKSVKFGKDKFNEASNILQDVYEGITAKKESVAVITTAGSQILSQSPTPVPTVAQANGSAVVTPQVTETPQPKPPRTDIKVILGTTNDLVGPSHLLARYLNESQKVPNENIDLLNSSEFTYDNFLKAVKNVGANATDNDTILINIESDGGPGGFTFSKEGIMFNRSDWKTYDYRPYKVIAEAIMYNENPNAKKVFFFDACNSGSAIPPFEKIPNSAVITSTTADNLGVGGSTLYDLTIGLEWYELQKKNSNFDYNGDGRISIKEAYLGFKKYAENDNETLNNFGFKPIPQISDPDKITDELFLTDK